MLYRPGWQSFSTRQIGSLSLSAFVTWGGNGNKKPGTVAGLIGDT